jgi:ketosteroid isomerase-like protein
MKNQAQEVVTEFLNAVQQVNTEKLGQLLHPDVEWIQPGTNQLSGLKKSSEEVFQMVGKMFELSANTISLTAINSISVNGNSIACLLQWNATSPSGKVLAVENIDVYTVEDGKIITAEVFTADQALEDEFWGN